MSGLVAIFNPRGLRHSLDSLIACYPTKASGLDRWGTSWGAGARLHHGVLDAVSQPQWDAARRFCVFAAGEVFDEADQPVSPAASVLRFLTGEPGAKADLNGSFCAIAFDLQQHRMIVLTDRLNTHPLYWFRVNGEVVIANQMAALTGHSECPRRLNRRTLHEMMAWRQVLGNGTIYEGIEWAEPASVTVFDAKGQTVEPCWHLRWNEPSFTRAELPEAIADAMRKAVGRRIGRDIPHGLLLSGGLDSRMVLAACDEPPVCLTLGDIETAQTRCAREAARLVGAEHHFLYVDDGGFEQYFDEGVSLTGAMYGYQQNHFLPIADRARQHVPVVMSGSYLDTFLRSSRIPTAKISLAGRSIGLPWLVRVKRGDLVPILAHHQKQAFPDTLVRRVLNPEARAAHDAHLMAIVREALTGFAEDDRRLGWNHLIYRSISRNYAFPNVTSIRSRMDASIVAWDHDLLDVSLQMRPEWGWPDDPYREALKILSEPLARLPYANEGLPTDTSLFIRSAANLWNGSMRAAGRRLFNKRARGGPASWLDFDGMLRRPGPMRERLEGLPDSEALAACGMFDRDGLRSVVDLHLSGRRDLAKFLLIPLTIEKWIDGFGGVMADGKTGNAGNPKQGLVAA